MADDDITGSMMREIARLTAERDSLQRQINSWALDHSAQLQGYKRDLDLALADSAALRSALMNARIEAANYNLENSVLTKRIDTVLSATSRSEHIVEVVRAARAIRGAIFGDFETWDRQKAWGVPATLITALDNALARLTI